MPIINKRNSDGTIAKTHGDISSVEYFTWSSMHQRCNRITHPGYVNYGGRGIKICQRWIGSDGYENFLADMDRRPLGDYSLDRIDNDGDYEPGNCRWATKQDQNRNRRDSNKLNINGEIKTIAEWAELAGLPRTTLHDRIRRRGWDPVDAISRPMRSYPKIAKMG